MSHPLLASSYRSFPKPIPNLIHRLQQPPFFLCIVKQVELTGARCQHTEAHADESDGLAAFVEAVEERKAVFGEGAVLGGVGYFGLFGKGVEISVAQFHGDAGGQFVEGSEFIGELGGLPPYFIVQECHVDAVAVESAFAGNRILLAVGYYGTVVFAIGFFPHAEAGFAEFAFQQSGRHFTEDLAGAHAHKREPALGFPANLGNLAHGQGREE